jgi:hypothetical protein
VISIKNKALNTLLVIFSLIIGVVLVELVYKILRPTDKVLGDRYYLMSGSNGAFRNINKIFLYNQNSLIRHRVWYEYDGKFKKEYSYQFGTNNYGLVQSFDVHPSNDSMLIIGDSFTEGTGAEPWFNDFARVFPDKDLQLINAGLLGTGFLHWGGIDDFLEERDFQTKIVIVIFISEDISRKEWVLPEGVLTCLEDWITCEGWENFLGIPPEDKEPAFLNQVKAFRTKSSYVKDDLKESLKKLLPATTNVYRYILRVISRQKSINAIDNFINKYGENLLFIHVPEKHELDAGFDDSGIYTQSIIKEHGGKVYDAMKLCKFKVTDYYKYDRHFNPNGYKKLSACVLKMYKNWRMELGK